MKITIKKQIKKKPLFPPLTLTSPTVLYIIAIHQQPSSFLNRLSSSTTASVTPSHPHHSELPPPHRLRQQPPVSSASNTPPPVPTNNNAISVAAFHHTIIHCSIRVVHITTTLRYVT
ncbi:hypothetical protein HanHA300_Chr04g0137911 [Helianthus annuus]|nr:hypothetical protein HanHA300_Chr04g0137911 [Helianthus annuus]KAJ0597123.1 hypothetical protein HanHA89_Chr04g0150901 [Helianthus annuus]KAJ0757800.1 hypothetical protein HanLR1_Chr04g0142951 [Helianthus annuus]KAJ0761475.1 hypothetical protein HanOQP8_Chr04g0150271 [Helianthus annuus]